MVKKFTADELIEKTRDVGMIPDAGSIGTTDDAILGRLNEALATLVAPRLLKTRENYFVKRDEIPLVAGQVSYRIPPRSMYLKLRDMKFKATDGTVYDIQPVEMERAHQYQNTSSTYPIRYYLDGEYIVLLPEDSTAFEGTLQLAFFMRPSDLVKEENGAVVTAVNTTTGVVQFAGGLPTTWGDSTLLDVHSSESGAEIKLWDVTGDVSFVGGPILEDQIEFTVPQVLGSTFGRKPLAVGDYVVEAGSCIVPPLPREWHTILARAAAVLVAESIGDTAGTKLHGEVFEKMVKDAIGASESRVESKPMRLGGRKGFLHAGW